MVAMSAAAGARSYLAPRVTPDRVRKVTLVLVILGVIGSSVVFSGSS
jgi:hypothetical protein